MMVIGSVKNLFKKNSERGKNTEPERERRGFGQPAGVQHGTTTEFSQENILINTVTI